MMTLDPTPENSTHGDIIYQNKTNRYQKVSNAILKYFPSNFATRRLIETSR